MPTSAAAARSAWWSRFDSDTPVPAGASNFAFVPGMAAAIAAVEPFADADEEEIAYSIALVTLCGTLAIVVLPTLGTLLHLSATQFGAWVGASVHDVGQVVAAASTHGDVSLRKATVVKLTIPSRCVPALFCAARLGLDEAEHGASLMRVGA